MMRWIVAWSLGFVLLTTCPTALRAQGPPDDTSVRAPEERQRWRDRRRQEMRRKIEVIRIARLTEELDLDAETAARLVPVLSEFDKSDQEHKKTRMRLGRELKELSNSAEADPAVLESTVAQWWDNEEDLLRRRRELFEKLDTVLSMQQRVRFMLFVPRFEREIRQLVRDLARDRRGGGRERPDRDAWFGPRQGGGPPGGDDAPRRPWMDPGPPEP